MRPHLRAALAAGLALAVFGSGCPKPPEPPAPHPTSPGSGEGECRRWGTPVKVGEVPEPLPELSGLAASRAHEGLYWAHNDSGHALELFALRHTGELAARFEVTGAQGTDVEDVAVGPCVTVPSGTCVFLADIGDNLARRAFVQLLEVEEPSALDPPDQTLTATALRFHYPDGPRDAETLLIDPADGVPHVVSKSFDHLGDLYRLEGLSPREERTAQHQGAFTASRGSGRYTTGGDVSPDGDRLLLRTYSDVWEVRGEAGWPLSKFAGAQTHAIPSPSQPQSEAIAWSSDGRAYLVGTEGVGEAMFLVECRD